MQLGLYLPGLSALSGVQSLRILESYELVPPNLAEPTASVHGKGQIQQFAEAGDCAVVTESHSSHDSGEHLYVRLFR